MAETDDAAVVAHRWIELYNDGTADSYGSDRFLSLYAPDCVWLESPTTWFPHGRGGNTEVLREALTGAQAVLRGRRADLHEIIADGNAAAMRYTWSATAAADGFPQPPGARLTVDVAAFLLVRNGRIVEIREILAPHG